VELYHLVGILCRGIPHPIVDDLMTSVPGDRAMRFDALVGSELSDQLVALGYLVEKTGTSERVLAHAVAQRFETSSSGALVPAIEGSTKPVTVTVANAGIATVEQYDLRMI
jgi:hypothetical protein